MKHPVIISIVWILASIHLPLSAQSIERSVISPFGFSYSGATFQNNCTVGEVIAFTGQNANTIITQGFQQPMFFIPNCLGDFDFNGTINVSDLLLFMGTFGSSSSGSATDLDGNGTVNVNDLLIFMGVFGQVCP